MNILDSFKKSFKNYLEPIFLVLFLFIIVIGFFIFNINDINKKLKNYNNSVNFVNKILVLHNDLEAFSTNRPTFVDYDLIVYKVNKVNELIAELKKEDIYKNFKKVIDDIVKDWEIKAEQIEKYKYLNSLIISSSSYIHELSKKIKSSYIITEFEDVFILDNSLINIFSLYVSEDETKYVLVEKALNDIKILVEKYPTEDFKFFYKKINSLVKSFIDMNELKLKILSSKLDFKLENLGTLIHDFKSKEIKTQQNLASLLFIISLIILVILIVIYNNSLKLQKELISFKYAVESSDNSIFITNENREIIYVNESFEKITGYKQKEVLGKNPSILKSGQMPEEYYKSLNDTLSKGEKWLGEFVNMNKNGDISHETASITPIKNDYDEIIGYLSINLDVTDYIKQQKQAEFLAYHDSLTSLPNRRCLEKTFLEIQEESKTDLKTFAILFLDLDGFKVVNDSLGHDIGDLLLKEVATRLKSLLRDDDYVFRIAGDEFAVLINYKDKKYIKIVANKIIKLINKDFLIDNNKPIRVGCSIGISLFPENSSNLKELLKYADSSMYEVKTSGKNKYKFYK